MQEGKSCINAHELLLAIVSTGMSSQCLPRSPVKSQQQCQPFPLFYSVTANPASPAGNLLKLLAYSGLNFPVELRNPSNNISGDCFLKIIRDFVKPCHGTRSGIEQGRKALMYLIHRSGASHLQEVIHKPVFLIYGCGAGAVCTASALFMFPTQIQAGCYENTAEL